MRFLKLQGLRLKGTLQTPDLCLYYECRAVPTLEHAGYDMSNILTEKFGTALETDQAFRGRVVAYAVRHEQYHFDCPFEDKNFLIRELYYRFVQVKSYCEQKGILSYFTSDIELTEAILSWFNETIFMKNPTIYFEAYNHTISRIIGKYEGEIPNVPKSELAEGYDFSLGIYKN